MNSRSDSGKVC